jgi:hypothetical protein
MDQFTNSIYSSDYSLRFANHLLTKLVTENERLNRVVEQAVEFAGIRVTADGVMIHSLVPVSVFPGEGGFPDLYAHANLKKAHLKAKGE